MSDSEQAGIVDLSLKKGDKQKPSNSSLADKHDAVDEQGLDADTFEFRRASGLSRVMQNIDETIPNATRLRCESETDAENQTPQKTESDTDNESDVQSIKQDTELKYDAEMLKMFPHSKSLLDQHESDTEASKTGNEDDEEEEDCLAAERKARSSITGRGVTLPMLIEDGIITPGDDLVSIDYLGNKFRADLMADGRIREGTEFFNSPSAWAIHCKKIVNPNKKSGCGWASVKYKGKKLDAYKSTWFRKRRALQSPSAMAESSTGSPMEEEQDESKETETKKIKQETEEDDKDVPLNLTLAASQYADSRKVSIKYSTLGKKGTEGDLGTLVSCTTFASVGKIQPFTISVTSNTLLLMDFHCHLTTSEVVGYLAGRYDANAQHLSILQAFPCRCRLADKENAPLVEDEIRRSMERQGLTLLGWYHSHPTMQPDPSLRDIDAQMDHQLKLKGTANAYLPCVGLIVSPFDPMEMNKISTIQGYYVIPPPENRPNHYGMPMLMEYDTVQDLYLTQDVLNEMKWLSDFFKDARDLIKLTDTWHQAQTYLDKMKASLGQRLPKDQTDASLFEYIQKLLVI